MAGLARQVAEGTGEPLNSDVKKMVKAPAVINSRVDGLKQQLLLNCSRDTCFICRSMEAIKLLKLTSMSHNKTEMFFNSLV
jgi:hypothetical protein